MARTRSITEGQLTVDVRCSETIPGTVIVAIDGEVFCFSFDMAARIALVLQEVAREAHAVANPTEERDW